MYSGDDAVQYPQLSWQATLKGSVWHFLILSSKVITSLSQNVASLSTHAGGDGDGGDGSEPGGGGGEGDGGCGGGGAGGGGRWGAEARSTGSSHCGGQANAGWLAPASLLATLGFVMCGWKAAQKAAATPMKMSVWKLYASFLAYRLR